MDINDGRRRTVSFAYTPEGQVLSRRERSAVTSNPEDQRYFVSGVQIGEITSNGYNDPARVDYARNLDQIRNWTPSPQAAPFRWNSTSGMTRGTFGGSGYDVINPHGDGSQSSGSRYTVRGGETLQAIAANLWGDASLWYLLAQANGLMGSEPLIAGQSLLVPDRVTNARNNAGTFEVYDPNRAMGDLSPTTPTPATPAKAKKGGKCGIIGQILLVAVAVAVTVLSSGAAMAAMGAANGIISGVGAFASGMAAAGGAIGAGTMIAAGAIGGAIGSIVSQGVGVATGIQDKFSWKAVGMSAIAGGIGGGITSMGASAQVGQLTGSLGKIGKFLTGGGFVGGAARSAMSSALTQGIGVATGLQDKFDWVGIAAAGLSGGVSGHLGRGLQPLVGAGINLGNAAGHLAVSGVSAMANAAARTLLNGSDFGDNLIAALPDVIGSTIGNLIAGGLQGSRRSADLAPASSGYDGDGMLDAGEEWDSYFTQLSFSRDGAGLANSLPGEQAGAAPPAAAGAPAAAPAAAAAPTGIPIDRIIELVPADKQAEVRRLMAMSPRLLADLARFARGDDGGLPWTVELRARSNGGTGVNEGLTSRVFNLAPEIVLRYDARHIVAAIAHEIGHIVYNSTTDWSSEENFARSRSREEGAAALYQLEIRAEIGQQNGTYRIPYFGDAGNNLAFYESALNTYIRAGSTPEARAIAIDTIGARYLTGEAPSGSAPPGHTGPWNYRAKYHYEWINNPGRHTPPPAPPASPAAVPAPPPPTAPR